MPIYHRRVRVEGELREVMSRYRNGTAEDWCRYCQMYCRDRSAAEHVTTALHVRNHSQGEGKQW
jgi:hypothetical protein